MKGGQRLLVHDRGKVKERKSQKKVFETCVNRVRGQKTVKIGPKCLTILFFKLHACFVQHAYLNKQF